MLSSLEEIHSAGYVYNNMKLDKILVDFRATLPKDYTSQNAFEHTSLHLIDFGFATKYLQKDKTHIPQEFVSVFRGNMMFGSRDQLRFNATSRKDDIESLMYLIVYLLNGSLLGLLLEEDVSKNEAFKIIQSAKNKSNVDDVCTDFANNLKKFYKEVMSIKFTEKPDYQKLKSLLEEALLA
jgi:casein kinase 1